MEKQQLNDTLTQLHDALAHGPQLDEESRERLSQLLADIQNVLQSDDTGESDSSDESGESLTDRLQDAIADFEAAHPQFSELMGRIADGLSQLGI